MNRWATRLPARAVFCCSKAAQNSQQALFPPRPTWLVYPAVDFEHVNPERLPTLAEARLKLGLPTQGPVIGTVARLERWKEVHVFLETAARVVRI